MAAAAWLVFAVLVYTDAPRWCIFTIMAFELAVGGLDNLLSHHKAATLALAWGGRVLGVFAMGGLSALIVGPCVAAPLADAADAHGDVARASQALPGLEGERPLVAFVREQA